MSHKTALALALVAGATLRFLHNGAGLPYHVGSDESVIAERAIQMMRSGSLHPHFFDYPSLYIYLQLLIGCAKFISDAMGGVTHSVTDFYPEHMFVWTRLMNAAIGTATIAVLYRAAVRWGVWVGVTAALIFAVWPNHVRESHYALTDVPLTFLTTATLLLSLRAYECATPWSWLVAGACAGFAAATKYNGVLALVMPLATVCVVGQLPAAKRFAAAATVIAASAIAFLIGAPYTVLDLPAFLNGFGFLSRSYAPIPLSDGACTYTLHMVANIGWGGVALAGVGLIWGTWRAIQARDAQWIIVLPFPLIYFYVIATKSLIFARYLLPNGPFLCLFMAILLVDVVRAVWRLRRPLWMRKAIAAAVVAAVLFPLAKAGIAWPIQFGRRSTFDVAYEQILEVIPKDSGVVLERSSLRLPEASYSMMYVRRLSNQAPQYYIARRMTYTVAFSDAFAPVLDRPSEDPAEYQAYQAIFSAPGHCLPTIQPTHSVPGPQIIICRLDAPIR